MKLNKFFLVLILAFSVEAFAGPKQVLVAKLKTFSVIKKKITKANRKEIFAQIDEMDEAIEIGVKYIEAGETADPEFVKELARVTLINLNLDPDAFSANYLLPLYENHLEAFKAGIQLLPETQAKRIFEAVEIAFKVKTKGNG